MKKIYLFIAFIFVSIAVIAAIDTKFDEGYEFKPLKINDATDESSVSFLSDSLIIYLSGDSVMLGKVDVAADSIIEPTVSKELSKFNIHGTVAYDSIAKKIYFSVIEDANNEWLYESDLVDGKWSKAKRLEIECLQKGRGRQGFLLNAGWSYAAKPKAKMTNPAITKDGKRLYFTSATFADTIGGKDIWYMEKISETMWACPTNLGDSINTTEDEDYAFVDGKTVYFSSNSKDSTIMRVYSSEVLNDTTYSASIEMGAPYNLDKNSYNLVVQGGAPFIVSDREGSKGADIYAFAQLPPPPPDPEVIYEEKKREFYWVFFIFDFDKDVLDAKFQQDLDSLSKQMKFFAGEQFEIAGYTDSRGSDEYNDKLSQKRAETIKKLLIGQGFTDEELVAIGYGKRRLQVPNAQTEEEHEQNRRVEVRIIIDQESGSVSGKSEVKGKEEVEVTDEDGNVKEIKVEETVIENSSKSVNELKAEKRSREAAEQQAAEPAQVEQTNTTENTEVAPAESAETAEPSEAVDAENNDF